MPWLLKEAVLWLLKEAVLSRDFSAQEVCIADCATHLQETMMLPISPSAKQFLSCCSDFWAPSRERKKLEQKHGSCAGSSSSWEQGVTPLRDIQLSQQIAPSCQLLCPHPPLPSFTSANLRPQLPTPPLLPQLHWTVARSSDLRPKWRGKWCVQLLQVCRFLRGNLDSCKK